MDIELLADAYIDRQQELAFIREEDARLMRRAQAIASLTTPTSAPMTCPTHAAPRPQRTVPFGMIHR